MAFLLSVQPKFSLQIFFCVCVYNQPSFLNPKTKCGDCKPNGTPAHLENFNSMLYFQQVLRYTEAKQFIVVSLLTTQVINSLG